MTLSHCWKCMHVVHVLMRYSSMKWENTAFLEASTGSSEALQFMCHIVLFCMYTDKVHWGSMDSRGKKLQHQIKNKIISTFASKIFCFFLHRIMKRGLLCRHQLCETHSTAETIQQVVYKCEKIVWIQQTKQGNWTCKWRFIKQT